MAWFRYEGTDYTKRDISTMVDYLWEQGCDDVYRWPVCDVVFWVQKVCPVSPESLVSVGRTDK